MHTLLLEPIDPEAHAALVAAGVVTAASVDAKAPMPAGVDDAVLADVDAIITRGRGQVTADLIARCASLRVIARCGVGLDNVDVDAASAAGVAVINAPGSLTETVAEHTVMLILAMVRGLYPQVAAVKNDDWAIRDALETDECGGRILGIVGLGAIGARVAELSTALGMPFVAHDVVPRAGAEMVTLGELLARADVVSLHVPLTGDTRGLIGAAELAAMKPGAFLVNTARGGLVDADAVADALDEERLAGYAADGVDPEPPAAGDRLIHHPRSIITPHSAALSASSYRRTCLRTVRNVLGYLEGSEYEPESVFNAARIG